MKFSKIKRRPKKIWNWIKGKFGIFWYWLKCHIHPKHRYHFLDLRMPGEYSYGWIDSDTQMILALFSILNSFVEHEMPNWYCPSEEEVQLETNLVSQRNAYLETKAIHYWWNIDRKRQEKKHDKLLRDWNVARAKSSKQEHQLWEDLQKLEKDISEKEDEMVERLLKLRHSLWT